MLEPQPFHIRHRWPMSARKVWTVRNDEALKDNLGSATMQPPRAIYLKSTGSTGKSISGLSWNHGNTWKSTSSSCQASV